MGRVVLTKTTVGANGIRAYWLLGMWRPVSPKEARGLINEVFKEYQDNEDWACEKHDFGFECVGKKDPGVVVSCAWVSEGKEDLMELIKEVVGDEGL